MNPCKNFAVAIVIFGNSNFPHVSFMFSARAEIFLCDYIGCFRPVKRAEIFSPVADTGLKLTSSNSKLRFSSMKISM